jgi:hypothetical protein
MKTNNNKISYEELAEVLSYDSETGLFLWKKRHPETRFNKGFNKKFAGKEAGSTRRNGYKVIQYGGFEFSMGRLAWLFHHNAWSEKEIDHINLIKTDNRIANLRESSRSENASNRRKQSNNTSGFKGIWKRKNKESWMAGINVNGKRIRLGEFKTPELAHEAYLTASKKLHKEFSRNE